MCEFTSKSKEKTATGYKVARKVGGRYYSPVTGIEYAPGKVKPAAGYGKYNVRHGILINDVLDPSEYGHDKNYVGMTAVFCHEMSAREKLMLWKTRMGTPSPRLVLLKMTLRGRLYKGTYSYRDVRIGSIIVSMEEVTKKKGK